LTLLQQTGRNPSSKVISKYWRRDTESLTFEDFVDVCRQEPVTSEDDLMKAFRKIDVNGDGYISLDELFRVMTTKGERMSRSEVKAMIDEVDENKDGKLDYREFSHMIISTADEYKKISVRMMEKKEKRKLKKKDPEITPRKEEISKSRPRSAGKTGRNMEPKNLRDWTGVSSKGVFYVDEDNGMMSHSYSLEISEETDVFISIQPLMIGESGESLDGTVVDTALFVIDADDNSLVAFTEHKDNKGKYSLRCSLSKGNYNLIPFTTGCRLKARHESSSKESKLVTKDKEGNIALTRSFRKALEEIFEMADLDGNGLLSREEFNWYNLRTSGEEIADDEWQVVEDNIELERGEITRAGFIKLNEMEADDNEGDTEDLWITLSGMGFNKSLILDEACPFLLRVYAESCDDPELMVTGLDANKDKINNASCELAISKGEASRVRSMKDLTLYTFSTDHRAIIAVDNKSKSKVKLELDCSRRRGNVSHTGSLTATMTVPPQTSLVGHHILPLDDRGEFSVTCEESILK